MIVWCAGRGARRGRPDSLARDVGSETQHSDSDPRTDTTPRPGLRLATGQPLAARWLRLRPHDRVPPEDTEAMGQPDFDDAPLVSGLRAPPAASPLHKSPKADLTLDFAASRATCPSRSSQGRGRRSLRYYVPTLNLKSACLFMRGDVSFILGSPQRALDRERHAQHRPWRSTDHDA